ncbi:MAG: TonB-dependent receptor [Sphingosinicella sp.]|nr:TonB-dependent receptor [Sphingosinicella sp.]
MKSLNLLGTSALRSAAFLGATLCFATSAVAQEVAEEKDPPATLQSEVEIESGESATSDDAIVVTGSRIRRPNLDSAVPITSVGGEEFFQTGQTSVGDTLNELPALRSTMSQANSTRFLGTSGLNNLDLRGLGTNRTLVLQNGRRHVASNILGNAVEVDTNTMPTDLIERVDVVTGGNSAIYGSDAIAGVVNFVLKRDFEGLQVRGQAGVSKYGDAGQYYGSVLAGRNFSDGRGNVAVNLEYARQQDFYGAGRPNLRQTDGFVVVDTDPASAPSDNQPDRVFLRDIRSALYRNGGAFYSCCNFINPADPLVGGSGNFTIPYAFQPNGTLTPFTGQRVGISPFGSFLGGDGDNFRDGTQFGLSPKLDRYSANLLAHFTVSEAFEPFIEAKFVRTDSLGNASGPFFTPATGSPREIFFTDNPYLSAQARNTILGEYGLDPATDDTYFYMFRNVVELSNREEEGRRDTFRIVGGVRGEFNDDWSYEVSANYGKLKERTNILGNVNLQRYLLSIDAVRNPANGNIVCRASIDPSARLPFEFALDEAAARAQLANDVAQCVPVNFFGEGNITQAARDYILEDSVAKGNIKELVLNAFLSGDTSEFLNLPGGPVGFAVGAEYRTYDVLYEQDSTTANGLTFYNAIPRFAPPKFEVKEAFGELRLPIIANDFIEEFTISGAGRVADYKGSGTAYAYNVGAILAPVRDLRFRANLSRAVRAPSLADAFTPLGQNFAPGFTDPCDNDQIGAGSANRAANCAAAGVPAGFDYNYTASLGFLSGGNEDLKPETSDSITIGGVLQPRFLPGFALSVDYYSITVDDVITSPSAQALVNACYDLANINNQFCTQFQRAGVGGGPRGEIRGRILENSLQLTPLNYAKLKVRGIDVDASYRRAINGVGQFNTRFVYTRALQNDQFLDPTDPTLADQNLLELGDPKDAFNWSTELKSGPFTIGYEMRYLGKMLLNTAEYEFFFEKQGRAPTNSDWAERPFYPSVFYHDIRLGVDVNKRFNMYFGVDDVTNRKPPFGQSGIGGGSGIYRNIGRFFYAGAVAKF